MGHVFDLRDALRRTIHDRRPRVVCLELDAGRYQALHRPQPGPRGGVPLTYRFLAYLQRSMAEDLGTPVGSEMLAAEDSAREVGASVALIDLEAGLVWRRLWSSMGLREKVRLFTGGFAGFVAGRRRVEDELKRYEEDPASILQEFGEALPSVQRVLIDERNDHMAEVLRRIHREQGDVVAVVGDGHVPGLMVRLTGEPVEAIRLKDLRSTPEPPANASYTLDYDLGRPGGP